MRVAILTGGTGFLGFALLRLLVEKGVFVYVIVRKGSPRRRRLEGMDGVKIIDSELANVPGICSEVDDAPDVFYHLAWGGGRDDMKAQSINVGNSVSAMRIAASLGAERFVATGSQAEYGVSRDLLTESSTLNPVTAYGKCKVEAYNVLERMSKDLGVGVSWARVFSVYGPGDNPGTLISYLVRMLQKGQSPVVTKATQLWDYLYVDDAVDALYMLGVNGGYGVWNVASGESRPLKAFIEEVRGIINPDVKIDYSLPVTDRTVSLLADISKIKTKLGWNPEVSFDDGIKKILSCWRP